MSSKGTNLTRFAVAWGFLISFPNPAIVSLSDTFSLQFGLVLSVFLLLLARNVTRTLAWRIYLLLCGTMLLTFIVICLPGALYDDVALKNLILRSIALIPIVTSGIILRSHFVAVLRGLSYSLFIHFPIGVWQYVAFSHNSFPLLNLYNNTQFAKYDNIGVSKVFEQIRPFGLYPEPSCLAAAISPLVVIGFALILKMIRLPEDGNRYSDFTIKAGGILGLLLILSSKSGQGVLIAVSLAILLAGSTVTQPLRQSLSLARISIMMATVGGMIVGVLGILKDRGNLDLARQGVGNTSWVNRVDSIVTGFSLWLNGTDWTIIFGYGGQISKVMDIRTRYDAMWSLVGMYIVDTGILGCLVWLFILGYAVRQAFTSNARLVGALVVLNWFAGVAVSTGYFALIPVWFWLVVCVRWGSLFPKSAIAASDSRSGLDRVPGNPSLVAT